MLQLEEKSQNVCHEYFILALKKKRIGNLLYTEYRYQYYSKGHRTLIDSYVLVSVRQEESPRKGVLTTHILWRINSWQESWIIILPGDWSDDFIDFHR